MGKDRLKEETYKFTLEEAYEKIKSFEKFPIFYQKLIVVIEELLLEKIRMQGGKE